MEGDRGRGAPPAAAAAAMEHPSSSATAAALLSELCSHASAAPPETRQAVPSQPASSQGELAQPTASQAVPAQPGPSQKMPMQPASSQGEHIQPTASQAVPAQPGPRQAMRTQPGATQAAATPGPSQGVLARPAASEAAATPPGPSQAAPTQPGTVQAASSHGVPAQAGPSQGASAQAGTSSCQAALRAVTQRLARLQRDVEEANTELQAVRARTAACAADPELLVLLQQQEAALLQALSGLSKERGVLRDEKVLLLRKQKESAAAAPYAWPAPQLVEGSPSDAADIHPLEPSMPRALPVGGEAGVAFWSGRQREVPLALAPPVMTLSPEFGIVHDAAYREGGAPPAAYFRAALELCSLSAKVYGDVAGRQQALVEWHAKHFPWVNLSADPNSAAANSAAPNSSAPNSHMAGSSCAQLSSSSHSGSGSSGRNGDRSNCGSGSGRSSSSSDRHAGASAGVSSGGVAAARQQRCDDQQHGLDDWQYGCDDQQQWVDSQQHGRDKRQHGCATQQHGCDDSQCRVVGLGGAEYVVVILVVKNDMGQAGDPYFQGQRYYQEAYGNGSRWAAGDPVLRATGAPALLLDVVGPNLMLHGVYTKHTNVVVCEPLTPRLSLLPLSARQPLQVHQLARVLAAYGVAADWLQCRYRASGVELPALPSVSAKVHPPQVVAHLQDEAGQQQQQKKKQEVQQDHQQLQQQEEVQRDQRRQQQQAVQGHQQPQGLQQPQGMQQPQGVQQHEGVQAQHLCHLGPQLDAQQAQHALHGVAAQALSHPMAGAQQVQRLPHALVGAARQAAAGLAEAPAAATQGVVQQDGGARQQAMPAPHVASQRMLPQARLALACIAQPGVDYWRAWSSVMLSAAGVRMAVALRGTAQSPMPYPLLLPATAAPPAGAAGAVTGPAAAAAAAAPASDWHSSPPPFTYSDVAVIPDTGSKLMFSATCTPLPSTCNEQQPAEQQQAVAQQPAGQQQAVAAQAAGQGGPSAPAAGQQRVFIKFTAGAYPAHVHRAWQAHGLAPDLVECVPLPGGVHMVVMQLLDPGQWTTLDQLSAAQQDAVMPCVEAALARAHAVQLPGTPSPTQERPCAAPSSMPPWLCGAPLPMSPWPSMGVHMPPDRDAGLWTAVHGDMRGPNIMVKFTPAPGSSGSGGRATDGGRPATNGVADNGRPATNGVTASVACDVSRTADLGRAAEAVEVKFIDLDWAGMAGAGRYPARMAHNIAWHPGAQPGQVMLAEHDVHLLQCHGRLP